MLGLGESVTFPSWQLIIARKTEEEERGRANGFVGAGQGIGPMLGTLFGGLAMGYFGWRVMFIGLGFITLLWLWPWFLVTRSGEMCSQRNAQKARATSDDDSALGVRRCVGHGRVYERGGPSRLPTLDQTGQCSLLHALGTGNHGMTA